MPKRPASNPNQLGFAFDALVPASAPASLAGLERRLAAAVSAMLKADPRSREVIAAEATVLMGDDEVSKAMLDAYASGGRPDHKVPASRLLAIVAVTGGREQLNQIVNEIGLSVIDNDGMVAKRVGQLTQIRDQADAELRRLKQQLRDQTGD